MYGTPTRLSHTSSSFHEPQAVATGSGNPGSWLELRHLEAAFAQWVAGRARPELLLFDPDGGATVSVSMEHALQRLRASARSLHPGLAGRLGLPDEATVGAAAAALFHARFDPHGPRCRSFHSAALYLVGLADLELGGRGGLELRSAVDVG